MQTSPAPETTQIVVPPLQLTILDELEEGRSPTRADKRSGAGESIRIHVKLPTLIPKELQTNSTTNRFSMAQTLLRKVRNLPGNDRCCDCGAPHPEWASTTLSSLVCLNCAGTHRSLGIRKSRIRSLNMDSWDSSQISRMLAGGNDRLRSALHVDGVKWTATSKPLSVAAARALYDSAAAAQYTRALDAKCSLDSESDEDEAPGFGSFIMQKMKIARKSSAQLLSPCVKRVAPDNTTMFCNIGRSFSRLFDCFSCWADKPAA